MSAKEIQHQLNLKDYPSVWLMMMKYRDIMGQRDLKYKLSKYLEMDIAFFPTSKTQVTNGIKNTNQKQETIMPIIKKVVEYEVFSIAIKSEFYALVECFIMLNIVCHIHKISTADRA